MASITADEFRTAVAGSAARTAEMSAQIAAQNQTLERAPIALETVAIRVGASAAAAAPAFFPASLSAPNASSSASTTPTSLTHGSHMPARADSFDMLHREKSLLTMIGNRRLEPFQHRAGD